MHTTARASLFIFLSLLLGCSPIGPNGLKYNRQDYNLALQQTNDEQLLLNLVRLKYRDTPQFIEVSSISSTFNLILTTQVSTDIVPSAAEVFGLNFTHSYAERPTISYSPLQGEHFIQRLLTPISLDKIILLNHSGWSTERLFRLCVQRLNRVKNAPSASGPTPDYAPTFLAFVDASQALRQLQKEDLLQTSLAHHAQQPVLVARIQPSVYRQQFSAALQLPDQDRYVFGTQAQEPIIPIETRSFLGVLYFLSQSVQIPAAHQSSGKVTITRTDAGDAFDWRTVVGDLMTIQVAQEKPETARTTVFYRDHWFYIDDADLTAKSTFSLLTQLFSLQAGDIKSTAPVLTLSVGE